MPNRPMPKRRREPLHQRIAYWELQRDLNDQKDRGWDSKRAAEIRGELALLHDEALRVTLDYVRDALMPGKSAPYMRVTLKDLLVELTGSDK